MLDVETRLAQGHWERAETRDVIKTYNLTHARGPAARWCPALAWDAWAHALGADEHDPGRDDRAPAVATSSTSRPRSTRCRSRTGRPGSPSGSSGPPSPYLSSGFVEENFDFYGRTLNGTPELRARWKRGVAFVEGSIGEAVGEEYVARHFPPRAKEMMDDLVANLLEAYRRNIEALDWMSEETKQRAYRKLETFRPKIGYPDEFRDYSALEVSADDLLGNVRAVAAFETDRELRKIGSPVDRDEWFMLPQHVNAYYNPGMNEICFPAGILQAPFFDADAEPAENYGGIGAVIGHEIGHGFDDQGSQYDELGNLENWWTDADRAAFQERADKLIEQYDGFEPAELPGEHVNGALTVGENIGDLGGITIALKAYLISLEGAEAAGRRRAAPARSGCSSTSPTSGAPSAARSSCSSCSPSTRTARRSSAPTSCATSTSSTTRSTCSPATASGSTPRTASASGDAARCGCRFPGSPGTVHTPALQRRGCGCVRGVQRGVAAVSAAASVRGADGRRRWRPACGAAAAAPGPGTARPGPSRPRTRSPNASAMSAQRLRRRSAGSAAEPARRVDSDASWPTGGRWTLKPLVSSTENSAVPIEAATCWVMFISVEPRAISWSLQRLQRRGHDRHHRAAHAQAHHEQRAQQVGVGRVHADLGEHRHPDHDRA